MERVAPIEVQSLGEGNAEKLVIGAIDELAQTVELADPDRNRGAVGDRAEPFFALGEDPFGQFTSRYVLDDGIHSHDPPLLVAMRDMYDFGVGGPAGSRKIGLVDHRLARQRPVQERPPSFVHRRIHYFAHLASDDLAQRTSEPVLIRLVGEAKHLALIDIGDQQRESVGNGAQPLFALSRGLFGLLAIRDIEMRANQFDGAALRVALDFRYRPNPTHLAVARANDPVFGLVMLISARDRIEKVFLD